MKRIKILHIVRDVTLKGGLTYYLATIIKDLNNYYHEILYLRGFYGHPEDFLQNIRITNLNQVSDFSIYRKFDIIFFHSFINNINLFHLPVKKVFFVHEHGLYCITEKKVHRFPKLRKCNSKLNFLCIINLFLFKEFVSPIEFPKRLLRYFEIKRFRKKFNLYIATTNYSKRNLIKNGINSSKIVLNSLFPSFESKNLDKSIVNKRELIYIGRFTKEKGMQIILKILRNIKSNFQMKFYGRGYYFVDLKRGMRRLNLSDRVKFYDWIKDIEELKKVYSESLITLFPSVWAEAFGLIGIESMLCGTPVIAFDVGGISDWLTDGKNGFLIKPYDVKEFARKIDFLLKNPDKAIEMGRWGRNYILEKFTREKHIKKLDKIIKDLSVKKSEA